MGRKPDLFLEVLLVDFPSCLNPPIILDMGALDQMTTVELFRLYTQGLSKQNASWNVQQEILALLDHLDSIAEQRNKENP